MSENNKPNTNLANNKKPTDNKEPKREWRKPPEFPILLILNILCRSLSPANRLLIFSLSLFWIVMFVFN